MLSINVYKILIWLYVLLETISFSVGGGNFRIYFIFSIFALFLYCRYISVIANSLTFKFQCLFIFSMCISAIFSSSPRGAVLSSISCILYLIASWVIAIIIISNHLSVEQYMNLLSTIALTVVAFGLFQYLVYRTTGIALTYQGEAQLIAGQIPGVSIEANGHGKMVGFAIILMLPIYIRSQNYEERRRALITITLSIVTFFISMTRMAFYSALITAVIIIIYYGIKRMGEGRLNKIIIAIVLLIVMLVWLWSADIIQVGYYSSEKLSKLFNFSFDSISEDGSGATRIKVITNSLSAWLSNYKTIFIGNGMGQAFFNDNGTIMKVAATGLIATLPSIGIFGWLGYAGMLLSPIIESFNALRSFTNEDGTHVVIAAEQTIFLSIYIIMMDFFSSTYVYAEMWMVIALGIFWGLRNKRHTIMR